MNKVDREDLQHAECHRRHPELQSRAVLAEAAREHPESDVSGLRGGNSCRFIFLTHEKCCDTTFSGDRRTMDALKAERQVFRTGGGRVRGCSRGDEVSGQYFPILGLYL